MRSEIVEEGKEHDQGEGEGDAGGADGGWRLGRRLGARDSGFFPSLPSVWCGIARAIPPAGAEQDRRGARQDEATNVAPKNVHALFFLVVGDIEIETVADRELRMDWWCT